MVLMKISNILRLFAFCNAEMEKRQKSISLKCICINTVLNAWDVSFKWTPFNGKKNGSDTRSHAKQFRGSDAQQ